jgi:hypothetical protein
MKEYLQIINATAERIYFMTRNKSRLSYEELAVLKAEISSILEDVKEAQKEALHLYEKTEG